MSSTILPTDTAYRTSYQCLYSNHIFYHSHFQELIIC